MENCSNEPSSIVGDEKLHNTTKVSNLDQHPNKENDDCHQQITPQNNSKRKNIDNSIFNTISKIVNPTAKVPEIKDFHIVKPISRGAFGKVFLGYKKCNPERMYAVKVMKKSEMIHKNMASQVVIERNALALTHSPYCVELFYSLQTVNCVYLVMEYMVGGDLKSLVSACGYMEESMAAFYMAEVTLALEYLHSHGIVHRDLKPDNMLLSKEGHVKLTDFGLSKISSLQKDLEVTDLVNGTPSLYTRTPGQILSLTSHLSFGSGQSSICDSNGLNTSDKDNRSTNLRTSHKNIHPINFSLDSVNSNSSLNDSHVSGVVPFHSANTSNEEEMDGKPNKKQKVNYSSDYHTCEESSQLNTHVTTTSTEGDESTLDGNHTSHQFLMHTSPLSTCDSSFMRGAKRKRKPVSVSTGLTQEVQLMELRNGFTPEKKIHVHISPFRSPELSVQSDPKKLMTTLEDGRLILDDNSGGKVTFSTPVSLTRSLHSHLKIDENQENKFEDGKTSLNKITRFRSPSQSAPELQTNSKIIYEDHRSLRGISPIKTPTSSSNSCNPYRTPKSVRRGIQPGANRSDDRILGTPDYLAPELLLRQGHGPAVDWWALGVCLFEFCTGSPPFNDETPQAVFANILARDIPWPADEEALSSEAIEVIDALLTLDPDSRPIAKQVRNMTLFKDFPWEEPQKAVPPFVPQPDDNYDTCYFQARNIVQQLNVSSFDI